MVASCGSRIAAARCWLTALSLIALMLAIVSNNFTSGAPSPKSSTLQSAETSRTGFVYDSDLKSGAPLERRMLNPVVENSRLQNKTNFNNSTTITNASNRKSERQRIDWKQVQLTSSSNNSPVRVDSREGRALARMQKKRQTGSGDQHTSETANRRNEDPWFLDQSPYPLQPYRFVYNVKGKNGQTEQYRQEVGDGKYLSGSYGYVLPDGIYRHVDYVADDRGFRAFIRTSEPGTANQNPANVVIQSTEPTGPSLPGIPIASRVNFSTPGGGYLSPLDSPTVHSLPLQVSRADLLYGGQLVSSTGSTGLGSSSSDPTNPNDLSAIRRPPGSIVGTSLRNFTSLQYGPNPLSDFRSTPIQFGQLPPQTSNFDNYSNRFGLRNSTSSTSGSSDSNLGGNSWPALLSWNSGATKRPEMPVTPPASSSLLNPLRPYYLQPSSGFDLRPHRQPPDAYGVHTRRSGPDVLEYDRFPETNSTPLKLGYDSDYLLPSRDSPLLALERARTISQLADQSGLRSTGNQLPQFRPLLANLGDLSPKVTPTHPGLQRYSSSVHRHHHEQENQQQHRVIEESHHLARVRPDLDKVELITSQREHVSGTKSGSGHDVELRTDSLAPPPAPSFPQAATKGAARLQAPYAQLQQHNQHAQQQQQVEQPSSSTTAHAPPPPEFGTSFTSPTSDPPPTKGSPAVESSVELASSPAPGPNSATKGGGSAEQSRPSREAAPLWSSSHGARSVRMPIEDLRASMMMNDLRSMQNHLGLPQPPRLLGSAARRSAPATPSPLDQLLSSKMRRVDTLVSRQLHTTAPTSTQPSQSQQIVGDRQGAASIRRSVVLAKSSELEENTIPDGPNNNSGKPVLITGPLMKARDMLGSELEALMALNDTAATFDARRLPATSPTGKLQSEKVSELERFQQRLRTQQLLLEQAKSQAAQAAGDTPAKLKEELRHLATGRTTRSGLGANSHVRYDEEGALTSGLDEISKRAQAGNVQQPSIPTPKNNNSQLITQQTNRIISNNNNNNNITKPVQPSNSQNSQAPSQTIAITENSTDRQQSELAKQIQRWPSLSTNTTNSTGHLTNSSNSQNQTGSGPNNINLDFINSVTALSVHQMNPFAISSVNPAVQRSTVSLPSSRLSAHKLESGLSPSSKYLESIDTVITSPLSRSDLHLESQNSFSDHQKANPQHWASNHRFPSVQNNLIHEASESSLTSDGFEVRDRRHLRQVDNHRFYEVISNRPVAPNSEFEAFKGRLPEDG